MLVSRAPAPVPALEIEPLPALETEHPLALENEPLTDNGRDGRLNPTSPLVRAPAAGLPRVTRLHHRMSSIPTKRGSSLCRRRSIKNSLHLKLNIDRLSLPLEMSLLTLVQPPTSLLTMFPTPQPADSIDVFGMNIPPLSGLQVTHQPLHLFP